MKPGFELVLSLHPRRRLFFLLLSVFSSVLVLVRICVTFLSVITFCPGIPKMPVEVSAE